MDTTPSEGARTDPARAPEWLPPGGTIEAVATGDFWDAVAVPRAPGEMALLLLGERTGAVIEDRSASKLYWLISPRAGAGWNLPGVDVLSGGSWLGVPGPHAEFRCRWRVHVDSVGALTQPDALRVALEAALARCAPGGYRSSTCRLGLHLGCRHSNPTQPPPDMGVVFEPCDCPCHLPRPTSPLKEAVGDGAQ